MMNFHFKICVCTNLKQSKRYVAPFEILAQTQTPQTKRQKINQRGKKEMNLHF